MAVSALRSEPDESWLDDAEPDGCVLRVIELDDGTFEERALPLTLELLLNPQEGDKVTQTDFHLSLVFSMLGRLRGWLESRPGVGVFSDMRFDWNRPGLSPSGPDIAVVQGLPASRAEISGKVGGTFQTAIWGVRPSLVIEVVSPEHGRLRRKDLKDNVGIFARAGVEEYLIFDPIRNDSRKPIRLLGHRLDGLRYTEIQPDDQGRVESLSTGLSFWSDPDGRRVEIFDLTTGERLRTSEEEKARADKQQARADEAEARVAAQDAEIARLRALLERRS